MANPITTLNSSSEGVSFVPHQEKFISPARLLLTVTLALFVSEAIVMLILAWMPRLSGLPLAVIDAFLLIVLVFPILYFYLMRNRIEDRGSLRLVVIVESTIFLGEAIVMVMIALLPGLSTLPLAIVDSALLVILVSPVLYYFLLRPMAFQIERQKQVEAALVKSNELLEKLFSTTHVLFAYLDRDFNFIQVNLTYAKAGSHEPEYFIGKNHFDLYPDAENEAIFRRVVETGEPFFIYEKPFSYPDQPEKGVTYWDWSLFPVLAADGSVSGVLFSLVDVTERKRAQIAQAESERRFQAIFNQTFQFIGLLRPDGTVLELNQTALDFRGLTRQEVVNRFLWESNGGEMPAETKEKLQAAIQTAAVNVLVRNEFELAGTDDRISVMDFSVKPLLDEHDQVELLIVEARDITERKEAEALLAEKNRELLALSEREHAERQLAEGLVKAAISLNTSLELHEVLERILDQIEVVIPCFASSIMLLEGGRCVESLYKRPGSQIIPLNLIQERFNMEMLPLLERISQTRRPLIVNETNTYPDWIWLPEFEWIRSYQAAPLLVGDSLLGILQLASDQPNYFTAETLETHEAFAVHAALAIQNARLYEQEQISRRNAEILSSASRALTETLNLEKVLERLLDFICQLVPCDSSEIALIDERGKLAVRASRGRRQVVDKLPMVVPSEFRDESLVDRLFNDRQSILIPDTLAHPGWTDPVENGAGRSWIGIPLVAGEHVIGLCGLSKLEPNFYTAEQVCLLETLVNQAAVALQNAWFFDQVRGGRERLQSLSHRLVQIQESERRYIARELHDEAGQVLTSLMLGLGTLEKEIPQESRGQVEKLKDITKGVLENLHRLAMDLRPASLDHLGLVEAIREYIKKLDRTELEIQFKEIGFEGLRLSQERETALYRIVQEALTNAIRHAKAQHVDVVLEWRSGKVIAMVEDDGIGYDVEATRRIGQLGIIGIQERAEMLGGKIEIESAPGVGTTIVVEVPDGNPHINRR